jgi:hypothetical protein
VCGVGGSLFPGMTLGRLTLKAAACIAVWLVAFALMPAEDRGRIRRALADARARGAAMLAHFA